MQQCEVFSGETLVSISIREKVSVTVLRRLNKLYGNEIFPGQILTLRLSPKIPEIPSMTKIPNDLSSSEKKICSNSDFRDISDHQRGVSAENISDDNRNPRAMISETIISADRAIFPEKISEIAKNVRSSIVSSLDTKQASMRSLVNSIIVPTVDNDSCGRSRSSSTASIAALSVSFTDKKAYKKSDSINVPPILLGESGILTVHHAKQLRDFLPSMQQIENWRLLYSVLNDGADLQSFFRKSKNHKYTVLIARTMNGEIFGGFNSVEWSKSSTNFYGSGEAFIFRFDSENNIKQYPWTGDNDFFVWSSENQIAMGGGKDGFAFVFDSDFATGESFCSATFGNPLLVHKENGSFRVANVECWGFEGLFGRVTKSSTRF